MNTLKLKIKNISDLAPKEKDFIEAGFDKDYAEQISKMYELNLYDDTNDSNYNLIDEFDHKVLYTNFYVSGFELIKFEKYEEYYLIGNVDVDYLVYLRETEEIVIINSETQEITSFISPNFTTFLDILCILVGYDKLGYLGIEYTESIRKVTVEKIRQLLKDKKYFNYFDNMIGL